MNDNFKRSSDAAKQMGGIRITQYSDGVTVKYRNRNIALIQCVDGTQIVMRKLRGDDNEVTVDQYYTLFRGKVEQTTIGLSDEGVLALFGALATYLGIDPTMVKFIQEQQ